MAINGKSAQSVKADSNGLQSISVPAGKSTIVLNLPAQITTGEHLIAGPCLNSLQKLVSRESTARIYRCAEGSIAFRLGHSA